MKSTIAWTLVLAVSSACLLLVSTRMHGTQAFDHTPELFSLKLSPYGRTIAHAMRGPADLYWHRGQVESHDEIREIRYQGLDDMSNNSSLAAQVHELKKREDEEEEAGQDSGAKEGSSLPPATLRERLLKSIKDMRAIYYTRTSPFGDSPMMQAWRWSEFERRLRLSYEMDPGNIICHGSYFLFASEYLARDTSIEPDPVMLAKKRAEALGICRYTIHTCELRHDEPSALISGASAAHDAAMILHQSSHPDDQEAMVAMNDTFDSFLKRYVSLRDAMIANGSWHNYPVYRRQEMEDAFSILRNVYRELKRRAPAQSVGPGQVAPAASGARSE